MQARGTQTDRHTHTDALLHLSLLLAELCGPMLLYARQNAHKLQVLLPKCVGIMWGLARAVVDKGLRELLHHKLLKQSLHSSVTVRSIDVM